MKYSKVIIWGHPLYSHTHSYVHEAYYRAFKNLGYDLYWFHDEDYLIMYCPSPIKYQESGRYIDVRMSAVNFKDHIQEYSLDKNTTTKIGPACYFVPKTLEKVKVKNEYVDYEMNDYEKVYIAWATNLLPDEFEEDDIYLERENSIYFFGTISAHGVCENYSNWQPFLKACNDNKIKFIPNDPWQNPVSMCDVIINTQKSILGIDIRGPEHLKQELLTCRVFKNISYGHLGLTNSKSVYEELEGNCIYNENTEELFYDGVKNRSNYKLISDGMKFVQENHTYINRVNTLLSIL